ncbi:TadE/TadG family type IV pilus assembly protein [Sphingobium cupriresistens]|uniref:Pilus assembly protein TadG n=1 Tax=Sphingobium cupriresistens TaxID=1132417 RepID=A0A8G1ZIR3_9SPHN|nr:TadE/TadG family type IV pilus assembly protein [Sphingobium cupriresistens]RYM11753.1 pilus assembly protein TadG [Sphingobium cupriresistens]
MGKVNQYRHGFLKRLAGNQAGNVMAMVAAAIIPLAALIGGGLDMSRAYMARARMQQACDSAALAGRRAMTGATMSTTDIAEARKFFDFNFPQNTFQAATFTPVIRSKPGETTTVQVTAETTMPTTIMKIFGYQTLPLAVTCESRFDIGNTDVMLVLDTTGSMSSNMTDTDGTVMTRLAALKLAVKDFYDTLGAGSDTTGRIRYGFMPYSSTANVGYSLPSSALVGGTTGETWNYQTRRAIYYYETSSTPSTCYRRYGLNNCYTSSSNANNASTSSTLSASGCTSWSGNYGSSPATTGSAPSNTTTTTYSYDSFNGSTNTPSGNNNRKCVRRENIVAKTYATTYTAGSDRTFYQWEYGQYPLDVSNYVTGNATTNPTSVTGATTDANNTTVSATNTWAGCIEERDTDSSITATTSTSSIPSGAYDLQIDTAPTNKATKWRPHWPDVEFTRAGRWLNDNRDYDYRSGSGGWNACPSKARKLASYTSRTATPTGMTSSFNSYVDGLIAVGGTYHDIGMMWGARFLSPSGIFASENANAPNGFNISRHIIFMTDGDLMAYQSVYGAYGYQALDGRVAATSTDDTGLKAIHKRRLEMMCNAIKGKGITIWVVGFKDKPPAGTLDSAMLDTELQTCANSGNHWFMAYNPSTLRQKFKDIAKNIGGLRLSQ